MLRFATTLFQSKFLLSSRGQRTFSTTTARATSKAVGGKISLTVADPALVLNSIATRYESTERIVLEYVDNALDDFELEFRENNFRYISPKKISVCIDHNTKSVTIQDNGRGISPEGLEKLVQTGQSSKRQVPWLNGQFGFGIHSFRATAQTLSINSKAAGIDEYSMLMDRGESLIEKPIRVSKSDRKLGNSGSIFHLSNFDAEWFRGLSMDSLSTEIEHHFDQILARSLLTIDVSEIDNNNLNTKCRTCAPFNFNDVKGSLFKKEIDYNTKKGVEICLKVVDREYIGKRARFYSNGRRINEVSSVNSFMNKSIEKHSIWGHPQLIGYIDVGDALSPVITRDEFSRSEIRRRVYDDLVKMEPALKQALQDIISAQRSFAFIKMESIVSRVFGRVLKEANSPTPKNRIVPLNKTQILQEAESIVDDVEEKLIKSMSNPAATEEPAEESAHNTSHANGHDVDVPQHMDKGDGTEDVKSEHKDMEVNTESESAKHEESKDVKPPPTKRLEKLPYEISFSEFPPTGHEVPHRSQMVDSHIYINTLHPDFQSRVSNAKGSAGFGPHLSSYVSAIVSSHHAEHISHSPPNTFSIYLNSWTKMDHLLRRQLNSLHRAVEQELESRSDTDKL